MGRDAGESVLWFADSSEKICGGAGLDFEGMARPERRTTDAEPPSTETPPVDVSDAVRWAYRFHRTKRRLRIERRRASQLAGLRFAVTLALLVFFFVVLSLTAWAEVQRLFGL
jgi:hypothetical protein